MMKRVNLVIVFFFSSFILYGQQVFQLAPPFMNFSSIFFKDTAKVGLSFSQPGTSIHYTMNGMEPSADNPVYKDPLIITKSLTTVKARVFGKEFLPSESVAATFVKDGLPLKEVNYPAPDERYRGEGSNTLMDNKGGKTAYGSKTWLGFKQDTVTVLITLFQPEKVKAVLFNLLQDQGSWIFFPALVEVYGAYKREGKMIKLGEMNFLPDEKKDISVCRPFIINFKKGINTRDIKLKFYILKSMPEWHPGKGQKSWIFIDEVKLY